MELTAGNVVVSEAGAFVCVVLCKAVKHVRYVELVDTTECLTLYKKCRRQSVRNNWVRLTLLHGEKLEMRKSFSTHSPDIDGFERESITLLSWESMKENLPRNGDFRVQLS